MPAQTVIKLRRGTAAQWTTANPVLAAGEMGIETDTQRSKYGDGTTAWASLNYTVADTSGVASVDWTAITSKPTEFPPEPHAASHELGGSDEIEIAPSQVTGTAIVEGDARLTDARTPTAHTHVIADITDYDPTPADNSVTTAKIADGAVTDVKLATDAVTTAKIASSAVTDVKLATDAVTTAKIASGAVTDVKLATGAVTTEKIADDAVSNVKISDLSATKLSGAADGILRVKAASTTGVSLTSTGNALTLGNPSGNNLAFDGDEVQARNDGAAALISINRLGGNVDIGTTTRGLGIDGSLVWANGVYGNVLSTSFRSVFVSNTDTRNKLGYVPSSRTLKKNIEPLRYTAEQVLGIEPVEFHYNSQADSESKSAGFIAEELHDAGLTAFVSYDDNGKPAAVHYEFFAVALQQVVRDQESRLKDLEQRIANLEK